jgi:hypothetical protein
MAQVFSLKQSLQTLLFICGGNKSEAGRKISVSREMIHRYINGKSKPNCDTVERLSKAIESAA